MGFSLSERTAPASRRRRVRRVAGLVVLLALVPVLSGCSGAFTRLGMPEPATEQGTHTLALWQGAWIAALATGAFVWGLIFFAVFKFRRRRDDEIPVQTRYNLPLEIFYTIFPIIMVIVFFDHTVRVQNIALEHVDNPDVVVKVVGQQWSWTFNYPDTVDGQNVYTVGTGADIPELVLPVDQTVEFDLYSPDVIHDFGVPGFLMKMDVIPGQDNSYQVTPTEMGTYAGKCYELCGVYHSRMLFTVRVVSEDDYQSYLQQLADDGNTSPEPILGGSYSTTQVGKETSTSEETE